MSDRHASWRSGAVNGLAAGALVLLVTAAIRLSGGPAGPAEALFDAVVSSTPGRIESIVISRLRHAAKPILLGASVAAFLAASSATGALISLLERGPRRATRLGLLSVAASIPFALGAPALVAASGRRVDVSLAAAALAAQGVYIAGLALWRLANARRPVPMVRRDDPSSERAMTRRDLLREGARLTLVAVAGTSAVVSGRALWARAARRGADDIAAVAMPTRGEGLFGHPALAPLLQREVTQTRHFYRVSKNALDPELAAAEWRLSVDGLVGRPLTLTLDEFKRFERFERYHTLICISSEIGDSLIGNAEWAGARLIDVLEAARVSGTAAFVNITSADGYVESITIEQARGTLLAYSMNGAQLEDRHGFPLRALVPGTYGMKNPKWITRITASTTPEQGYWNKLGWDAGAPPKIFSRIDVPAVRIVPPGEVIVGGVAFAGDRGISRVEVSVDDGRSWLEADLRPALSAHSWRLWAVKWTPAGVGEHVLAVRATDGNGTTQPADVRPPFPSGATGYHRITLTVRGTRS